MQAPSEFKDRLREALEGYSRTEVCERIGKSLRAMTGWLSGANQPLVGTVIDLCLVINVSPNWLLLGIGRRRLPRRGAA